MYKSFDVYKLWFSSLVFVFCFCFKSGISRLWLARYIVFLFSSLVLSLLLHIILVFVRSRRHDLAESRKLVGRKAEKKKVVVSVDVHLFELVSQVLRHHVDVL